MAHKLGKGLSWFTSRLFLPLSILNMPHLPLLLMLNRLTLGPPPRYGEHRHSYARLQTPTDTYTVGGGRRSAPTGVAACRGTAL